MKRKLTALLATAIVALTLTSLALATTFWPPSGQSGHLGAGTWVSTAGYAPRGSSSISVPSGVSGSGYLQIKYEAPDGTVTYNSLLANPSSHGPRTFFSTSAGGAYVKVFCRWGDPGQAPKVTSCEWYP